MRFLKETRRNHCSTSTNRSLFRKTQNITCTIPLHVAYTSTCSIICHCVVYANTCSTCRYMYYMPVHVVYTNTVCVYYKQYIHLLTHMGWFKGIFYISIFLLVVGDFSVQKSFIDSGHRNRREDLYTSAKSPYSNWPHYNKRYGNYIHWLWIPVVPAKNNLWSKQPPVF